MSAYIEFSTICKLDAYVFDGMQSRVIWNNTGGRGCGRICSWRLSRGCGTTPAILLLYQCLIANNTGSPHQLTVTFICDTISTTYTLNAAINAARRARASGPGSFNEANLSMTACDSYARICQINQTFLKIK